MKAIQPERIKILKNESPNSIRNRLVIATPTLGIIRIEWATGRFGQVIPCNFSSANFHLGLVQNFPMGYLVADAQNIAVEEAIKGNFEWLFFLEDDVIMPPNTFVMLNDYMNTRKYPVVSGLYYLKANHKEPLVYRGRGNSAYTDWKQGEKLWVDGVPTGCLLINMKVLKIMYNESKDYLTGYGKKVKMVFETPAKSWTDPETCAVSNSSGTSDLNWCDRVMKDKVLQRAGWKKIGGQKYPFLLDTNIKCGHIDLSTGRIYPIN